MVVYNCKNHFITVNFTVGNAPPNANTARPLSEQAHREEASKKVVVDRLVSPALSQLAMHTTIMEELDRTRREGSHGVRFSSFVSPKDSSEVTL